MRTTEFANLIIKHTHISRETFNTRVAPFINIRMTVLERAAAATLILRADGFMTEWECEAIYDELAGYERAQEESDKSSIR